MSAQSPDAMKFKKRDLSGGKAQQDLLENTNSDGGDSSFIYYRSIWAAWQVNIIFIKEGGDQVHKQSNCVSPPLNALEIKLQEGDICLLRVNR